jgi:hypothetical protein
MEFVWASFAHPIITDMAAHQYIVYCDNCTDSINPARSWIKDIKGGKQGE